MLPFSWLVFSFMITEDGGPGAGGAREVCPLPTSASDQLPAPIDSCS